MSATRPALYALIAAALPGLASAQVQAQAPWKNPFFGGLADPVLAWLDGLPIIPILAGVLLCGSAIAVAWHRMRVTRRAKRLALSGLRNGARFRVLDAMCHAVWKGAFLEEARLKRLGEITQETIGASFSPDQLREMVRRADRLILPHTFGWMRDGLTREERMVIFNATVSVLLADGPLTRADRRLLRSLSRGLRLGKDDLRDLARLTRA